MADSQPGPRPAWSGAGLGLAAVGVALFVIFFAPTAPVPEGGVPPTVPTSTPGRTITLEEFQALLTNGEPGEVPPASFEVDTPDGPVTVVVPPTTTPPTTSTTTTTTSAPPPTSPPRPTSPIPSTDSIIDDLLGRASVQPTIPEGAGGAP